MFSLPLILVTAIVSWTLSDIHGGGLFQAWICPAIFVLSLLMLLVWIIRRARRRGRGDVDAWDLADSCLCGCSGWGD